MIEIILFILFLGVMLGVISIIDLKITKNKKHSIRCIIDAFILYSIFAYCAIYIFGVNVAVSFRKFDSEEAKIIYNDFKFIDDNNDLEIKEIAWGWEYYEVKIDSKNLNIEEFVFEHLNKEYYDTDLILLEMIEEKEADIKNYGGNYIEYDFSQYLPEFLKNRNINQCYIYRGNDETYFYFYARGISNSDVQEMLKKKRTGIINKTNLIYQEICYELEEYKNK